MTFRAVSVRFFWIDRRMNGPSPIDLLFAEVPIHADGVALQVERMPDEGYETWRLVILDHDGVNAWLPEVREGQPIPVVDVSGLKKLRLAWLVPEGVS